MHSDRQISVTLGSAIAAIIVFIVGKYLCRVLGQNHLICVAPPWMGGITRGSKGMREEGMEGKKGRRKGGRREGRKEGWEGRNKGRRKVGRKECR